MGDVPRTDGSLLILEDSHKIDEIINDYGQVDVDRDRDRDGWFSSDPADLAEEHDKRWLTTDFEAGDVLVFSMSYDYSSKAWDALARPFGENVEEFGPEAVIAEVAVDLTGFAFVCVKRPQDDEDEFFCLWLMKDPEEYRVFDARVRLRLKGRALHVWAGHWADLARTLYRDFRRRGRPRPRKNRNSQPTRR